MGGSTFPVPAGNFLQSISSGPLPGGGNVLFAATTDSDGEQSYVAESLWCNYKMPGSGSDATWNGWLDFNRNGFTPLDPNPYAGNNLCGSQLAVCSASYPTQNNVSWFAICDGNVYTTFAYYSEDPNYLWPTEDQQGSPGWSLIYVAGQAPALTPGSIAAIGGDQPVLFVQDFMASAPDQPTLITLTAQADNLYNFIGYPPEYTPAVFDPQPPYPLDRLVAAPLPNGGAQLWGVDGSGMIYSNWTKGDFASGWTDWTSDWNSNGTPFIAFSRANTGGNAAGVLPDGRVQLWVCSTEGTGSAPYLPAGPLMTCWKETTAADSNWTEWKSFLPDGRTFQTVTVAPLSDGRLQLFAANPGGGIATTWKQTTDPDSEWMPWQDVGIPPAD